MYIERYLAEIAASGAVSEVAFYTTFANYILNGLLGYPSRNYLINKSGQSGTPDIRILSAADKSEWIVCEAKLDDADLRDDARRERIWREQIVGRRYITGETVYVLLCAPHSFRVCDVRGALLKAVDLDASGMKVLDRITGAGLPMRDSSVRDLLHAISGAASEEQPQYEAFRKGELEGGYISLSQETLQHLRPVFEFGLRELKAYTRSAFDQLRDEYRIAQDQRAEVGEQLQLVGDDPEQVSRVRNRERKIKRKYRAAIQVMEEDYPQFRHDQAYAGTEREQHFEDIFVTNAAYIALTRVFFVLICEDLGLTTRKISHEGPGLWGRFVRYIRHEYKDLLGVAYQDAKYIYSKLFEETVFDWYGEGNGRLNRTLEQILFRLNAFSFANVDRDLLGTVYQYFRPRAERKRLGEYYTPEEVVDYILARTGISSDSQITLKRILDPACGSFTFGVRAIIPLLAAGERLTARNKIDLVQRCIIGRDINPFSVFLSHLSLLFTMLDVYRAAKDEDPAYRIAGFNVANVNSLAPDSYQVELGLEETAAGEGIEAQSYDYVIGNPPFVRNERLPGADREALEAAFAQLRSGNTDLATYFLYSAMNTWLKEGGVLGMVAPIGQANAENARILRQTLAQYSIYEIVSLEWMAKAIFPDADIIPMLLFIRKAAPHAGHRIAVVTGLQNKAELEQAATEGEFRAAHTSEIDYEQWLRISPTGDWPLDVTGRDMPILDKLGVGPRLSSAATPKYGIKLGAAGAAIARESAGRTPSGHEVLFAKGQHVCAFGVSDPQEVIDLSRIRSVSDPSIWGDLTFYRENQGRYNETGLDGTTFAGGRLLTESLPSDTLCPAVPKVYPTLVTAVIDPLPVALNDSAMVVVPRRCSGHVLAAVVNSRVCRYYAFLTMRAAILLRRRATWYPRVLKNLPWPALTSETALRLHNLAKEAAELSAETPLTELSVFLRGMAQIKEQVKAGLLGVYLESALEAVDSGDLAAGVPKTNQLAVGSATIHGPDADTLLLVRMAALASEVEMIDEHALQGLMLPTSPKDRNRLAEDIRHAGARLESAQDRMDEIMEEIDEIVAAGLGLTPAEHAVIQERCTEFPLSVTVGRPRYVWSPDRKTQARRVYAAGERFR